MEKTIISQIHTSALKFLEPLTIEETYRRIVEEARRLVGAEHSLIILKGKRTLENVYASSPLLHRIKPRKGGFTSKALRTRKTLIIDNEDMIKAHPELKQLGIKSVIYLPLSYKNQSIGVLSGDSGRSRYFTKKNLQTLQAFGSLASLAIRKAQLYNEIKRALEARDLFISLAAHELRTPLTSISGYVQLLKKKFATNNGIEARWVRDLYAESVRLTLLVNELLEVNRIKTGQFQYNFKECNLKEIIRRAIKNFNFSHPKRKLIYQDKLKEKEAMVIGDFNKIMQVFTNILDNAVKFSPANTDITFILKRKGAFFVITIKDKGQGIASENLPLIFEGLAVGKNANTDKKGMGLGLLLAKHIVTYHRGSIDIRSKLNQGTTVEIRLPRVRL